MSEKAEIKKSSDKKTTDNAPNNNINLNWIWAIFCVLVAVGINRVDYYYLNYSSPKVETSKNSNENKILETTESVVTPSPNPFHKEGEYILEVVKPPEEHPNENLRNVEGEWTDWPPGHMGLGVQLTRMSKKINSLREEMYNKHAFEEFVSELIPLDRELPDWRDQWCSETYDRGIGTLPKTSIIICFHNEAWSTLLRSVHSIINRSPKSLIQEIILVDDNSSMDHLGEKLDNYIQENFPPDLIKIVRLKSRHGLMKSRMEGIKVASAQVLTFLDSHIEACKGWLEPLLHRIRENPTTIPSPVIDAINDTSLYYTFIKKDLFGLMNWKMEFEWHELSQEQRAAKPHPWAPHNNPIMAGGLFSIDRDFFQKLGFYDQGMNVWGGENFELSFKAWMCGGSIEVLPCSRVGHIYRSWSPYRVEGRDIKRNNIRVAKVWMDKFQYLYFDRQGNYDKIGDERLNNDFGDVSDRIKLREELKCHDFQWYLDNVASGLPYHRLKGAGYIRNVGNNFCLDKDDKTEHMGEAIEIVPCHYDGGNQYWWINVNNYLMRDYMCIGVLDDGLTVVVNHCGHVTGWDYDVTSKLFKYHKTGTCLTSKLIDNSNNHRLTMDACRDNDPSQQWELAIFNPSELKYEELFIH